MISIIVQCVGFSILFLIVYHFWFASKDNQLEISEDGQATQEELNPNWVEEESSISNEDLSNAADQIINEVKSEDDKKKVDDNNEAMVLQDEEQENFHQEDSVYEGEELEHTPQINDEGEEPTIQDSGRIEAMEDNDDDADGDPDVLETVPSIDYLKET